MPAEVWTYWLPIAAAWWCAGAMTTVARRDNDVADLAWTAAVLLLACGGLHAAGSWCSTVFGAAGCLFMWGTVRERRRGAARTSPGDPGR